MKKPLIFLNLFFASLTSFASNFEFGGFTQEEVQMSHYSKDSDAHAVVLREYGKAFIDKTDDEILLYYQYHVKIKLFDNTGLNDQGNVAIYLYKDGDRRDRISGLKGITTYRDKDGNVKRVELDADKMFTTNLNKHYDIAKFAMPGLTNGCIIEYTYTIETPFFFNFHQWEFQWDIPKMYSEYQANIPAIYNYNIALRGSLKLTKNTSELERECFTVNGIKCDCSNLNFVMTDIPAFRSEDYMTAEKNFKSAINFELSDYTSLISGGKVKVTKDWKDIDYTLKTSEDFGSQIKRKELMLDRIKPFIDPKSDDLAKAKAIYAFIQHNIKWNGLYDFGSDVGIRKALDTHQGCIGDINLALIAGLRAAGINTEAVLLSTREHGIINKLYPVVSDFDYVIAKVNIGDATYLLDATDPLLGFGMLPERCLNDQGRVVSLDKPSYWIDMKEPQLQNSVTTANLILQPNGKLTGTFTFYSMGYQAYLTRQKIKKYNSLDDYVEHLENAGSHIKIIKSSVSNLDSLDAPVTETYEVEINATHNISGDRFSFNPHMLNQLKVNPFKLAERNYPVDMGVPSTDRFVLNLQLPAEYTIESNPQDIGLALPNQGGRLVTSFSNNGQNYIYSEALQFGKSVYMPDEYPYLKELYNKIIQSQKTEIVFKKKS